MLLRELFEAENKTAVMAFGRMNPPTIGHKKLADRVASLPGDPYIFLSQSRKPKTDPLDFATKVKFAQASFPNVKVGSADVKTIIQALQKIESMGYNNLIYVAGSDRVEDFTNLINKYNGTEYNFDSIKVASAGERDPDADGAEGMSASKMRAAAAAGDFDSFSQGVPNPKIAQQMYDAVRAGMGINEATRDELIVNMRKKQEAAMLQKVMNYLDKLVQRDPSADVNKHAFDIERQVRLSDIGLNGRTLARMYKDQHGIKEIDDMKVDEVVGTLVKVGAKLGGKLAKAGAKKLGAKKATQSLAKKTGKYAGAVAGGAAEYKIAQKMGKAMPDEEKLKRIDSK